MTSGLQDRFLRDCEQAILGEDVYCDLYAIAIRMRLQGLSQDEAYQVISSAKETVTGTKYFEGTAIDDAICDALDHVVGYCSSSCHIWSPHFDLPKAVANLEKNHSASI